MDDWVISTVIGGGLALAGGLLIAWHLRARREHQSDTALDERERSYFEAQFRRRLQTSAMLVLIGLMVVIGDLVIPWGQRPAMFAVYWGVVIILTFWVMILGLGDLLAARVHGQMTLNRFLRKQQELEQAVERLKRQQSGPSDGRQSG